jgi:hypothetical protein
MKIYLPHVGMFYSFLGTFLSKSGFSVIRGQRVCGLLEYMVKIVTVVSLLPPSRFRIIEETLCVGTLR